MLKKLFTEIKQILCSHPTVGVKACTDVQPLKGFYKIECLKCGRTVYVNKLAKQNIRQQLINKGKGNT